MAKKHLSVTKSSSILENTPYTNVDERRVTKSPNFFSAYTNDMQVTTGPWDVRISIGEVEDVQLIADKPIMTVNQLGEVRMSVQIAKRLILMLADQLRSYETTFGQIPGPPDPKPKE
jgi:hypothetical protein